MLPLFEMDITLQEMYHFARSFMVKSKGNRVTIIRNGHYITRNVLFCKKFPRSFDGDTDKNDDTISIAPE